MSQGRPYMIKGWNSGILTVQRVVHFYLAHLRLFHPIPPLIYHFHLVISITYVSWPLIHDVGVE